MSKEYMMLVGKDFYDLFSAEVKHLYKPTNKTKKELDRLHEKNKNDLNEFQAKAEQEFILEYGEEILDFVKCISSEYFLVGKSKPFGLSWNISSDENDDYISIRFYKGKFDYVKDICGGYALTEILEADISFIRVIELLNS